MNILVTGKDGQLGSEIQSICDNYDHNFIFKSSKECNICDPQSLEDNIIKNNIDAIINCAAYTAVDNAEDDIENAFSVNQEGVQNIDELSIKHNLKYIHISTDYVFDGEKNSPYKTNEPVSPIGVYGESKRRGEEIIINSDSDSIIIRTSWLYSSFGNNFVKTMLRLSESRNEIGVVSDQFGSPTYANDLAIACCEILDRHSVISIKGKVFHFSNQGITSWSNLAKTIFNIKGIDCNVKDITTAEFQTKAKRPKYSVLDTSRIETELGIINRNWKNALSDCLKLL